MPVEQPVLREKERERERETETKTKTKTDREKQIDRDREIEMKRLMAGTVIHLLLYTNITEMASTDIA